MASGRGTTQQHTSLITELCKACTGENLAELKTHVKSKEYGGLRAGELEKLKDMRVLLEKLEKKRVFKQGNYGKLIELFRNAEFEDGVEIIEESEGAPMDQVDATHQSNAMDYQAMPPPATKPKIEYQSMPPPAATRNPHQLRENQYRDQDDALPIIEELPIYQKGIGYLLVINNFVNVGLRTAGKREGANIDERNIKSVFGRDFLRTFDINIKTDLKKSELETTLVDVVAEINRHDYKSFICIIGSHGRRNKVKQGNEEAYKEGFLSIDEELITEDDITQKFESDKLPKLTGCPKVFIFQCCRGDSPGRGALDRADSTEVAPSSSYGEGAAAYTPQAPKAASLPTNADMLIVHATSKGTKAWRNNVEGSWFINTFCETLKHCYRNDHLLDILLRVNSKVGQRESSEDRAKQMPCQVSTLTKKFMLGE